MPIGIVSDEDFEKELKNTRPEVLVPEVLGPEIKDIPTRGRKEGDVNVPNSIRKIIGETSEIEGRQEAIALAKMFGISASSVSAYANGSTSTASYDSPKPDILKHIRTSKERVSKKARRVLTNSLSQLTPEKLQNVRARDLASIAKDMSAIIKDMEPPKSEVIDTNAPQFVIYAPQFKKEEHFEVIIADE